MHLKKANNVRMGLFGIIVIVLIVVPLGLFFDWFWKVFPFAEKHPLVIWAIVSGSFMLAGLLASSANRG